MKRRVTQALVALALCSGAGLALRASAWLWPFPVAELSDYAGESYRFYARDGEPLREAVGRAGTRGRWTALGELSPLVVQATLASEDQRFYEHGGVDLPAVVRAAGQNLAAGQVVSGASTLSMQLARLLRGHQRTLVSKLGQAYLAWRLEARLSKAEILEHYLNRAPYGAGAVGVEAASQRYFGKPSTHLSLAEAALLAGLPQAPTNLNPLKYPERAKQRRRYVLERMLALGLVGADAFALAADEPLTLAAHLPAPAAMHFTDWLITTTPPGEISTTIDLTLQRQSERLVAEHVAALSGGGLTQAAVVVLDNASCDILALVGSADYWDGAGGSNNGALAPRQPGSALKPFVYALAFSGDFSPASVAGDIPTQYLDARGLVMRPRNYSEKFSGPVLMGEALGRSLNVPAVRTANAVGLEQVVKTLRRAGFASLEQSAAHYGLGVALGNGEVTLLELAQAYATLARGGLSCVARGRRDLPPLAGERVFSPEVSYLISDILADESLRVRAFGAVNPLLLGFPMAVKTGTSSNWRDNWAAGYTDRYTVAVWTGDFAGNPMNQLSGAIGAGPLFAQIARLLTRQGAVPTPPAPFVAPPGVEEALVCPLSGALPTADCPTPKLVRVLAGKAPHEPCTWHQRLRVDKRNGLLASPRCPRRFVEERVFERLPPAYAAWQAEHQSRRPPAQWSPFCPNEGLTADAVVITHPRAGDVFLLEPGYATATQTLQLTAEVDPPTAEVTWEVDGQRVARAAWPYEAAWPLGKGRHELRAVAGGKSSDPVSIEVR